MQLLAMSSTCASGRLRSDATCANGVVGMELTHVQCMGRDLICFEDI
jgi:hypothetical protein